MKAALLFTVLLTAATAYSLDLTTRDGKAYEDVTNITASPTEIRFYHRSGAAAVPLSKLPDEWLKRLGRTPDTQAEKVQSDQRAKASAEAYKANRLALEAQAAAEMERQAAVDAANPPPAPKPPATRTRPPIGSGASYSVQPVTRPDPLDGRADLSIAAFTDANGVFDRQGYTAARRNARSSQSREAAKRQAAGLPLLAAPTQTITVSTLNGESSNLQHGTVYPLWNGQVWRQTDLTFTMNIAVSPEVIVYPCDGQWWLKMEHCDTPVAVELIEGFAPLYVRHTEQVQAQLENAISIMDWCRKHPSGGKVVTDTGTVFINSRDREKLMDQATEEMRNIHNAR